MSTILEDMDAGRDVRPGAGGATRMDQSTMRCGSCGGHMTITRLDCETCGVAVSGAFEPSALARLSTEEQVFVVAFLRHHGSIKKMESLFGISYPTVKNRLNAVIREIDRSFEGGSPNLRVLEALERGEISVDEAIERME